MGDTVGVSVVANKTETYQLSQHSWELPVQTYDLPASTVLWFLSLPVVKNFS